MLLVHKTYVKTDGYIYNFTQKFLDKGICLNKHF